MPFRRHKICKLFCSITHDKTLKNERNVHPIKNQILPFFQVQKHSPISKNIIHQPSVIFLNIYIEIMRGFPL